MAKLRGQNLACPALPAPFGDHCDREAEPVVLGHEPADGLIPSGRGPLSAELAEPHGTVERPVHARQSGAPEVQLLLIGPAVPGPRGARALNEGSKHVADLSRRHAVRCESAAHSHAKDLEFAGFDIGVTKRGGLRQVPVRQWCRQLHMPPPFEPRGRSHAHSNGRTDQVRCPGDHICSGQCDREPLQQRGVACRRIQRGPKRGRVQGEYGAKVRGAEPRGFEPPDRGQQQFGQTRAECKRGDMG
ncbi:MAG: hypothetical protein HY682_12840 [Chloroflexi bacterium]|nr:hypothetical protein [Chloroflexota bacterium]